MPGFLAPAFAFGALVAASGPLIVHLIERRRCRLVAWGAMELLAEALGQQRRKLLVRDRALLVLRTGAVVAFGLAMSRPYWSATGPALDSRQPLHAVLVIDNSQSMAYEQPGSTLLEMAKAKASRLIHSLPVGSEVSIVPWCGDYRPQSLTAPVGRGEAEQRLATIEIVPRSANVAEAVGLAGQACRSSNLPAKRVIFFTDQQAIGWPADSRVADHDLPEVQVASMSNEERDNAWVAELSLPDRVADADGESLLTAVLRYRGAEPRRGLMATLKIDDQTVAEQPVELVSGEARRLVFRHRFTGSPGVRNAAVSLQITPDFLPADDRRELVVPVAVRAPVLVVEEPTAGAHANPPDETAWLRRLIGPRDSSSNDRALTTIQRTTIDQLTPEVLKSQRLVIVAGVRDPSDSTALLRGYVEEGGQLLIAAGGDFDPSAWNNAAGLAGEKMLPLPLLPKLVGHIPSDGAADIEPFWLTPESFDARRWRFDDLRSDELEQIVREPVFFCYVAIDTQATSSQTGVGTERAQTLAVLNNGAPLIVERQIGRGHVVFYASGLASEWNTLAESRAVLLLDRLVRRMLYRTVPPAGATANAPAAESDLRQASEEHMRRSLGDVPFRLVPPHADVRLTPADVSGEDAWRWFMAGMFALLITEQAVLAISTRRGREAAT